MEWKPKDYADERRARHPGRGLRMDYENSRTVAIEEFCRQCVVAVSAADCTAANCPLFPYRPGADAKDAVQRRPGVDVPTREWYEQKLRELDPDGSKAAAARERFHGKELESTEVDYEPEW